MVTSATDLIRHTFPTQACRALLQHRERLQGIPGSLKNSPATIVRNSFINVPISPFNGNALVVSLDGGEYYKHPRSHSVFGDPTEPQPI